MEWKHFSVKFYRRFVKATLERTRSVVWQRNTQSGCVNIIASSRNCTIWIHIGTASDFIRRRVELSSLSGSLPSTTSTYPSYWDPTRCAPTDLSFSARDTGTVRIHIHICASTVVALLTLTRFTIILIWFYPLTDFIFVIMITVYLNYCTSPLRQPMF